MQGRKRRAFSKDTFAKFQIQALAVSPFFRLPVTKCGARCLFKTCPTGGEDVCTCSIPVTLGFGDFLPLDLPRGGEPVEPRSTGLPQRPTGACLALLGERVSGRGQ